jgi:hypothetical protein
MKDDSSGIIKLLILGAAGLGIWWYLNQPGANGTASLWAQWFPSTTVPATTTTTAPTTTTSVANPGTTTTAAGMTAPVTLPTSYAQAAAALVQIAGGNSLNFDQWSYYWQNNSQPQTGMPAGFGVQNSISSNLIDAMIAAGGGNRAANISAVQWVTLLYNAQQSGISGLGFGLGEVASSFAAAYPDPYKWTN